MSKQNDIEKSNKLAEVRILKRIYDQLFDVKEILIDNGNDLEEEFAAYGEFFKEPTEDNPEDCGTFWKLYKAVLEELNKISSPKKIDSTEADNEYTDELKEFDDPDAIADKYSTEDNYDEKPVDDELELEEK